MITNFNNFTESIKISQYKPYHNEFNRERYKDLFNKYKELYKTIVPEKFFKGTNRNAYRIFLPYTEISKKSDTQLEIENILKKNGIELDNPELQYDYIGGTIIFPGSKNTIKIGKILSKYKRDDLNDKFASDKTRSLANKDKSDYVICISRHPYDIVGADTDKRWKNCMTLAHYNRFKDSYITDGGSVEYLMADVKSGTIVAFLVKLSEVENDVLKDPYANINIKAYSNIDNPDDFVLVPDNRVYGVPDERFKEIVFNWCKEINDNKIGYYKLNKGLYIDNYRRKEDNKIFKDEEDDSKSDFAKQYLPK